VEDRRVPHWQDNRLWKVLEQRESQPGERLRNALGRFMPQVEHILESGGSAATTFTLHDAEHSRRVAERIFDLAGESLIEEMDSYDIGLLLFAAFLHDIGMTPPMAKPQGVVDYLLTGESDGLEPAELASLQAWLDDEGHEQPSPNSNGAATSAALGRARSLTAEYARSRHNEWSAQWMGDNLGELDEITYSGCLDDLVRLCKSHHQGIAELRAEAYEPRWVGAAPATVLHLRFDACLLRVADVLDFDPERTPRILYEHREVEESSAIFWHKDHELSLVKDGRHISIHARPPNALVHHAIELTIADINRELQLCQRLAEETQFQRMAGRTDDLPHRWNIDTNVRANVKPRNDEYVYMDGTFRPDQERILELLGGVALYGTPMAAVRELLQNAFDAVREQIALERLRQPDPAAEETRTRLAAAHRVSVGVVERDDETWLVVSDTGTGMSRDLVNSRFLVGGSRSSHETKALERECRDLGFSVGRTSRFGIGVLSYFLLARRMRVHTRRSIDAGGQDGSGWTFISDGLTDFGELRLEERERAGTTVELLIRDDAVAPGEDSFTDHLVTYVKEVTRRVPCPFDFPGVNPAVDAAGDAGWLDHSAEVQDEMLVMMEPRHQADDEQIALYPAGRRKALEQSRRRWEEVKEIAAQGLWISEFEEDLPEGLGQFRALLGFFKVMGHRLLQFFDIDSEVGDRLTIRPLPGAHAVDLGSAVSTSWNGMAVRARIPFRADEFRGIFPRGHGIVVEIDFTDDSAGIPAVDRETLTLTPQGREAVDFAIDMAHQEQAHLLGEIEDSPFALINARAIGTHLPLDVPQLWPAGIVDMEAVAIRVIDLRTLGFPVIDASAIDGEAKRMYCDGEEIFLVPALVSGSADSREDHASWHAEMFKPQKVIAMQRSEADHYTPLPLWAKFEADKDRYPLQSVPFPPEWAALASIEVDFGEVTDAGTIWNGSNPLLAAVDLASWEWVNSNFEARTDPLDRQDEILASPARTAAWILFMIENAERAVWEGLADRAPEVASALWNGVPGLTEIGDVYIWAEGPSVTVLRRANATAWTDLEAGPAEREFGRLFARPDAPWLLTDSPGSGVD
jgi:hypothetical protein